MARIVFGIFGEGRGHTIRSKTILTELRKRHEIILFAGGQAYDILKDFGLPIEQIPILKFGLGDGGSVKYWETVTENLPTLINMRSEIKRVASRIKKFRADLVVSDFEPTVSRAASRADVRCVCLDHQHILTNCVGEFELSVNRAIFHLGATLWNLEDDFYLVTSFFRLPVKPHLAEVTRVVPPIIRPELRDVKPGDGEHFLVYQTYNGPQFVTEKLYDLPFKFKAFPAKKQETIRNTEYMTFDTENFVEALRNCRGIVSNGGHTLISEALFLGKPVLSIPVEGQYEQELNAQYVKKFGYGLSCSAKEFSRAHFEEFASNIDTYRKNISAERFFGNDEAIEVIENQIEVSVTSKALHRST